MRIFLSLCLGIAVAGSITGCSPQKLDVRAQEGRPEAAEVSQLSIPYNPSASTFVLVVEPFQSQQSVITYTHGDAGSVPIGEKMAAQLTTALLKVGNFSIVDYRHQNKLRMQKREKGPYIVRAVLTEFNELSEAEAEDNGISLGLVGVVAGIAGAVSGKPGLMWSGAGLAAASPSFEDSHEKRVGMVAFDVTIIDQKTGRVIDSFDSSGRFIAESAVSGFSLFGIGAEKAAFASSALGQALRVAMNDTAQKAHDALVYRR